MNFISNLIKVIYKILENFTYNFLEKLWYLTGILSFFAATGYVFLHYIPKDHFSQTAEDNNPAEDLQSDSSNEITPETDVLP